MIERVSFHRFKQYKARKINLRPRGVTLIAGGNNAGKSSILHGLAVWEFCRVVLEQELGPDVFASGWHGKGIGMGAEDFSPINVPSLRHLWTNLKTQKTDEPDGYTLKVVCEWRHEGRACELQLGMSLANDRLFIKPTSSNLLPGDPIPRMAYLPPFAGITDREPRMNGAIRRRRLGEGLAGAVLRNLILDMQETNRLKRADLQGDRSRVPQRDLDALRSSDAWELLQQTLREVFQTELVVEPFREEYHSYITVDVAKGKINGHKFLWHKNFNKRDLMVEGSGFLQWLSVYTLALNPGVDVLLLDEPDAHLHCSLQNDLLARLASLAAQSAKQVLVATHSAEILRQASPNGILEVRGGGQATRYLSADHQKIGLMAGLGSDYAPRIDKLRKTKRLFMLEGQSDESILRIFAERLEVDLSDKWVVWRTTHSHSDRKRLVRALREEIPDIVTYSLRDRDDDPVGTVGPTLEDRDRADSEGFYARKWRRRHIESYLIWPPAIARASGMSESEVEERLRDDHSVAVSRSKWTDSDAPQAALDINGKLILKEGDEAIFGQLDLNAYDLARNFEKTEICDDICTVINELAALA